MHFKAVFSFFASFAFFLLSVLCLSNDACFAKGLTCDFYDISDIPDGWTVTVPPGFNERKSSLGHYVNEEKNTSLMIQIAENKDGSDLEEVTRQTLESLRSNGCTLLKEPVRQGDLMRLEVTSTGLPAIMWLGTDGDVMSVTVLCGDMEEGRHFLTFFHAGSKLIPSANLVFQP